MARCTAIVTNLCTHDIFVWSIPATRGFAVDVALSSSSSYIEPFRAGTAITPGIAIKVSSNRDGISESKSELDLAYTVDAADPRKTWINLTNVRGRAFKNNVTLFTCHGPYETPFVPTRPCKVTDDIELVLCGTERSNIHTATANCSVSSTKRPRECTGRVVGPQKVSEHEQG